MTTSTTRNQSGRQRRRGPALEAALLDAAWKELSVAGYVNLTMESVAARAHTGVAVLYRRWANKEALVLASLEYHRSTHVVDIPDTGTLRDDLIMELQGMGQSHAMFFVIGTAAFSGFLANTGLTPAQMRNRVLGENRVPHVQAIYQRAHDRGELNFKRVPPAVLDVPFDLVRQDLVMNLEALKDERIVSIVDEIFLPLLRAYMGSN